ncbi:MAG TPA: YbhB/YbcL family Raf kinase inhibitor-like protein [Stackebrandtia sp.]|uniref:YbhB/YbcL family Raf kinase inhibitor-like protein n=1 Tax=Stackebrandtia sp. TaxID=2023065 RepID=UPI002D3C6780|nr:YbhB/YbcL family Raf kinase inhibitor-like protein [Stackebrandtia sp.]HZE40160.1 YbhB/YbcL family Raf kinase inhibitor-like protein [Stackebrandtia sp.]
MKSLIKLLAPLGFLLRRKRADPAHSIANAPELAGDGPALELTSSSFADKGTIPRRHATMDLGPNTSPALAWSDPPPETARMLLIMEDTDTPTAKPMRHMVAFFDPGPTGIDEGELTPSEPRFTYLRMLGGRTGYQGPRPLPGHGVHHYGFHLYALDEAPALEADSRVEDVLPRLDGHVVAAGHLEGVMRG